MSISAWSIEMIASKPVALSIVSSIISSMDDVRTEVLGVAFVEEDFFASGFSSVVVGLLPSSLVGSAEDCCCLESSAVAAAAAC